MRRLTSIKKSRSPPPSYSMDNPVFEDGTTATVVPAPASPAPQPQVQHVHIRLVTKSEGSNMIEIANYIDEYNIVNRIHFVGWIQFYGE